MENKNLTFIFAAVNLHKKNNIQPHENFTGSDEVLDELQDTILKGRTVNELSQKLFDQH